MWRWIKLDKFCSYIYSQRQDKENLILEKISNSAFYADTQKHARKSVPVLGAQLKNSPENIGPQAKYLGAVPITE